MMKLLNSMHLKLLALITMIEVSKVNSPHRYIAVG